MKTKYADVPGFPGYRVGDDGTVWTNRKRVYRKGFGRGVVYAHSQEWIQMAINKLSAGYVDVQLHKDGESFHRLVHRLVLLSFVGSPPKGYETFHINNVRSDNRLCNLKWASKTENQRHRKTFRTDSSGERHARSVVTNATAALIRKRFLEVGNRAKVAREFGISRFVASRIVAGKTYRIVYTITRTAGSINARFSGGTTVSGVTRSSSGTYVDFLVAVAGNNLFSFSADATFAGTVDNVYMREVTGNDGYQITSASRPTLKALYNKVINSGFSGATTGTPGTAPTGWPFGGSTGTTDSVSVSDDAGGFRITYSATAARQFINQTLIPIAANEIIDSKITIYANTGLTIAQSFIPQSFPVGAVATYFANGSSVASSYVPVANDVITARLTNSTTAGTFLLRVGVGTNAAATGTITFGKCDIRTSNDGVGLPDYQFVNTATDYDTTGFPPYLSYDGTDDHLIGQPNLNLSSGDKVTVWAGQRKLRDGLNSAVVSSAASTASPGYFVLYASSSTASYRFTNQGTIAANAGTGTFTAVPSTDVLTGIGSISGDIATLKVDGTVIQTINTDQGTGNYRADSQFYFGRLGSVYFQGRVYSLIVRVAESTDTQISNTENYVNSKTKAY